METQTSMHAKTVHLPCPTNPALKKCLYCNDFASSSSRIMRNILKAKHPKISASVCNNCLKTLDQKTTLLSRPPPSSNIVSYNRRGTHIRAPNQMIRIKQDNHSFFGGYKFLDNLSVRYAIHWSFRNNNCQKMTLWLNDSLIEVDH